MNDSSPLPRITQVASQLPPVINGVGDFCFNLWEHWPRPRPDWRFLVCDSVEATRRAWAGDRASCMTPNAEGIRSGLEAADTELAVVQYVNYGFNPYGKPLWLPPGLADWKQRGPRRRLVVMFHELFAIGPIYRKAFWIQPYTRGLVRDLLRLADGWITSCSEHENKLLHEFHADPARGTVIPIGSNIPVIVPVDFRREPDVNGRWKVVVFGLANTRLRALENHRRLLVTLARQKRLQSITLLGKKEGSPKNLSRLAAIQTAVGPDVAWEEHADLEPGAISKILVHQDFGLLTNSPETLTKSGVCAALTMHGVIPVISAPPGQPLAAAGSEGVLRNDDSPASISALLPSMADGGLVRALRGQLERRATEQLSWSAITARWEMFLRRPFLGLGFDGHPAAR